MTILTRTYQKVVVIDAKAHLLGRLASIISKHLLCGITLFLRLGHKIVVVRCEELNQTGSFFRNKRMFLTLNIILISLIF